MIIRIDQNRQCTARVRNIADAREHIRTKSWLAHESSLLLSAVYDPQSFAHYPRTNKGEIFVSDYDGPIALDRYGEERAYAVARIQFADGSAMFMSLDCEDDDRPEDTIASLRGDVDEDDNWKWIPEPLQLYGKNVVDITAEDNVSLWGTDRSLPQ